MVSIKTKKLTKVKMLIILVSSVILSLSVFPLKAEATTLTVEDAQTLTPNDKIGRYQLNYTGNTNYVTDWIVGTNLGEAGGYSGNLVYNDLNFPSYINFSTYKAGETQYYTKDNYGMGKITSFNSTQIQPNSSTATLTQSEGSSEIVKAYLIWYTRDSGNLFSYYDDPVWLYLPTGEYQRIYPTNACIDNRTGNIESFLCLAADVTDYVKAAGYGTYGVANIPYWYQTTATTAGNTAGSATGGWQLIVIEEGNDFPVRKVDITINSKYAYNGYTGHIDLSNGLTTSAANTTGQIFFSGYLAGTENADGSLQSISTFVSTDKGGSVAVSTTRAGDFVKDGVAFNSGWGRRSCLFADMESVNNIGSKATQVTFSSEARDHWDTYFCLAMAVDVAFPDLEGQQETILSNDNSVIMYKQQ